MIKKITKSFMHAMNDYLQKRECGKVVEAKYVQDRLFPGSAEMKLGAFFEYNVSGGLPKDGIVPKAEMMANGKDMYAPYRLAVKNAERVKQYLNDMGLRMIAVGKKFTRGRFEGTIDIIVECTKMIEFDSGIIWKPGDKMVLDLKYSGLLDDRWSEWGWMWTPDQTAYHYIQATQYEFIAKLPFYYLVCSSKNAIDIKMTYVEIDKEDTDRHILRGNFLWGEFMKAVDLGFIPYPEVSRCSECPLKDECQFKHTYPHPRKVTSKTE